MSHVTTVVFDPITRDYHWECSCGAESSFASKKQSVRDDAFRHESTARVTT